MNPDTINHLIAKYLSGNASDKEVQILSDWRKAEGNEKKFREFESTWQITSPQKGTFSPDLEKAWQRLRVSINEAPVKANTTRSKKLFYVLASAAALIPFIIFSFLVKSTGSDIEKNGPREITLKIEPDKIKIREVFSLDSVKELVLPDGSKLWLNSNSRFSYPENFTGDLRAVNLEGEAFFEIARDTTHPFVIYTENSVTRVLGTAFNLKAYKNEKTEIVVVSGKVEFSTIGNPDKKIILLAEDKGEADNTSPAVKLKLQPDEKAWKNNPKTPGKFQRFLNRLKKVFKRENNK